MTRIGFAIVMAIFLAGCTATGPLFTEAPADNEKALVYVYRVHTAWAYRGATVNFKADGVPAFDLQSGGYTYVYLAPGHHTIAQNWPVYVDPFSPSKTVELDVKAQDVRYVRFYVWGNETMFDPGNASWDLTEQAPAVARRELARSHYQPAKP